MACHSCGKSSRRPDAEVRIVGAPEGAKKAKRDAAAGRPGELLLKISCQ